MALNSPTSPQPLEHCRHPTPSLTKKAQHNERSALERSTKMPSHLLSVSYACNENGLIWNVICPSKAATFVPLRRLDGLSSSCPHDDLNVYNIYIYDSIFFFFHIRLRSVWAMADRNINNPSHNCFFKARKCCFADATPWWITKNHQNKRNINKINFQIWNYNFYCFYISSFSRRGQDRFSLNRTGVFFFSRLLSK